MYFGQKIATCFSQNLPLLLWETAAPKNKGSNFIFFLICQKNLFQADFIAFISSLAHIKGDKSTTC